MMQGDTTLTLYDLNSDMREEQDVSGNYPDVVRRVKELFRRAHTQAEIEQFRMRLLGDEVVESED